MMPIRSYTVDDSVVIVENYSYDVFGEPNRVSDVNNPYFFTGRRYDAETGLYYYHIVYDVSTHHTYGGIYRRSYGGRSR